jgi:dihydroneopterin aldolase
MNATWSVKVEGLCTELRVGLDADELAPQPVWVTLHLRGVASACPSQLSECIDYAPLHRWITEDWPRTAHVPLLETRLNELVAFAFELDERVQEVRVGLAKQRWGGSAGARVGLEREVKRPEFAAQVRHQALWAGARVPFERTADECLHA